MSVWDFILPHRFFINQALRTASDDLRAHIDAHNVEYEKAVAQCKADVEEAKIEKDKQFDRIKQEYLAKLSQDSVALGDLQGLVIEYLDQYFREKYLRLAKEKTVAQSQLLYRRRSFLSEQIKLISEDITSLEERKDVLSQQSAIDDIVALIRLSGCNLQCDDTDNPKTLLKKVNIALSESDNYHQVTRNALIKMRTLLQERTDFLPVIQYITWMINQRKNLRRELATERREIKVADEGLKIQISSINSELRFLRQSVMEQATRVRDFSAIPIANTSIKLAKLNVELNDLYERLNSVQEEIDHMQRLHSSDSDRRKRLWEEKRSLKDRISELKRDRDVLFAERNQWYQRRSIVLEVFKSNEVFLVSPNGRNGSDEVRVLLQERVVLTRVIAQKKGEHGERKKRIVGEYDQQEKAVLHRISEARKMVDEKESARLNAEQHLRKCKVHDSTPFLLSFFFESDEVARARAALQDAERRKEQSERKLDELEAELDALKSAHKNHLSDMDRQYSRENGPSEQRIRDIDLGIDFIQNKGRR